MQRTQKIIAVLALVLALLFTGCSASEPAATTTGGQTITAGTADTTAGAGSKAANGNQTTKTIIAGTTAKSGTTGSNAKTTGKGKATGAKTAGAKGKTTTRSAGSTNGQRGAANSTPAGSGTTRKQTTKKHTTKKHTTTRSKAITCTVTVECKNIQKHMGQLKSGHERFVPEDGVIIHKESHTVSRGSTAYDLLKLACNANGVRLTTRPSSYGIYVVGINNLDEKDCGSASGWMYKVNGTVPMVSCDKYKMDDGNNLVFYYVCTSADR